jgi:hypothetical protein
MLLPRNLVSTLERLFTTLPTACSRNLLIASITKAYANQRGKRAQATNLKSSHPTVRAAPALNLPLIAPIMVDAAEWHEQLRYLSETVPIVDDFRNWG